MRAAANERQRVELCREFGPELIVTDDAMPGLNGIAAAAEVNREQHVAVILISGRHDAEGAGLAHVVGFLAKPIKNAELAAAVASVVAARKTG